MKRSILVLLLMMIFSALGFSQLKEELKKEIDKIILYDTQIKLSETPGFVIAVKIQDSIYYYGYGTTNKETETVPDENTIFEIGGLTTAFTSSLVSVMNEDGTIDYDSTLNFYLPKNKINNKAKTLTINQLLTHTSGMPKMPTEFGVKEIEQSNPYAHYTYNDLSDFYKDYIPFFSKKKKKEKFLYAHLNYALLELAIRQSAQKEYETLLMEKILQPLRLSDTRIILSADQKKRMATGHSISGVPTPAWTFRSFKASTGLKSTASDLVTFVDAHIDDNSIFSSSFGKTHEPICETGLTKNVHITRGWHLIKNKRYFDIIVHSGSTDGHRSFLAFVKESDTAVVVLTNSERSIEGLGYLILKMINNNWDK